MEVIFSLTLFFAFGVVILGALDSSLGSADRVLRETTAADLAATKLAETRVKHLRQPVVPAGPETFEEPRDEWQWEIIVEDLDEIPEGFQTHPLQRLIVRITHLPTDTVYKQVELVPANADATVSEEGGYLP